MALEMAGVVAPVTPAVFVVPTAQALRTASGQRVAFAKYQGLGNDFVRYRGAHRVRLEG